MKKLLLFAVCLTFFSFAKPVSADEGWVINNFHSDIALQDSGRVRVVETIEVDFRSLSKHGIFRDIPYIYENGSEKMYTDIDVESVMRNDKNENFQRSLTDEGYVELKIGDADKTISGRNMYTITYTAKGVLRSFSDHDELYWNVTGNNWPVTIHNADAEVTISKPGIQKVTCYQGYAGGQGSCEAKISSSQVAQFTSTESLDEDKGMTVVVGYTKGLLPILTVQRPKTFWEKFIEWPSLTTLGVFLLGGVGTVFYLWYKFGRDNWFAQNIFGKKNDPGTVKPIGAHETITVEFTPPEKLRPAEIGVLIDEKADTTDVVATIIDLATRGYMKITEVPKKWVFGKVDYKLEQTTPAKKVALLDYESLLLDRLFEDGTSVTMSSLKKTFYASLAEVKKALYADVVEKNLFLKNPDSVRNTYLGFGIVFVVIAGVIIGSAIDVEFVYIADLAIALFAIGVVLIIMSRFMPRRTAYGRELYRRIKGYQLFISTAEKYRQRFFEKKNMFNEVLPYAITFGLTEKFARQMHDIGLQPSTTGWYVGTQPFNTSSFGSNVTAFSSSLSSAMASTPSSSGGFSGGSSGGGFGGGGGGSW
jgi:uncharacterized membrane protein